MHVVHARSPEPGARPLLLGHGWPGSIVEYLNLVGPLAEPARHGADRADAFHVVLPSIPGFGLSTPLREPGWDIARIAAAYAELMARLGYRRYAVHGSDWGALIGRELGRRHPDRVAAAHLTWLPSAVATAEPDPADQLTDEQRERLGASVRRRAAAMAEEMGYGMVQSARPQTLAYGLTDSPVGQLTCTTRPRTARTDPPLGSSPPPCPPAWRRSPTTLRSPCDTSPSAPTRSCTGRAFLRSVRW